MNPYAVTRILKKLAAAAGMDTDTVVSISGHSLRVGPAHHGLQMLSNMRAGGSRSTSVAARYVENVDINVWG
jgi:integrase/recombinase XerD